MSYSSFNPATVAAGTGGGGGGASSFVQPIAFQDTFTDTGTVAISSHTADTGHTWTKNVGTAQTNLSVAGGSAYNGASFADKAYSNYPAPLGAEEATITIIKGAISGTAQVGICLRCKVDPTAPRGYTGRWVEGSGYQFMREDYVPPITNSVISTIAGAAPSNGDTLRFTVSGTGASVILNLYLNGGLVATYTDTAANRITVPGTVGIIIGDPGFTGANYRIDSITSPGLPVTPFWVNVEDYGAVADLRILTDITMTGTDNVVDSAGYTFTAADIGKTVTIRGTGGVDGISPMNATIIGVSGGNALLSQNATSWGNPGLGTPKMWFGTDNVDAFNRAVAAVSATGGTLFIPAGNYWIGMTKVGHCWTANRSNINLVGEGIGRTNLYYSSSYHAVVTSNITGSGLFISGAYSNITISDFTIEDTNYFNIAAGGNPAAICTFGVSNLRMERVEMVNAKGNSAFNAQGVATDLYISECKARGDAAGGFIEGDGFNAGNYTNVHFTHNYITGVNRHGYEGGGNCYDQVFDHNILEMGSRGMSGLNPTGGNRTSVIDNTIVGCNAYPVDFTTDVGSAFTCRDVRIIGNYLETVFNGGACIRCQNTTGDVSIANHVDRIFIANNYCLGSAATTNGILSDFHIVNQFPSMTIVGNRFNLGANGRVLATTSGGGLLVPPAGTVFAFIGNTYNRFLYGAGAWAAQRQVAIENNVQETINLDIGSYGGYGTTNTGTPAIQAATVINAGVTVASVCTMNGLLADGSETVLLFMQAAFNANLIVWGRVTAANTVTIYVWNPTGGNLAAGATIRFIVKRQGGLP